MKDKTLVSEYAKEHTVKETAEHFGYSVTYVYSLQRKGMIFHKKEKLDKYKDVKEFICKNTDKTAEEIASAVNLPQATIGRLCRLLDVKLKRKPVKKQNCDRNKMILCLKDKGFTLENIGKVMGITKQAVSLVVLGAENENS